MLFDLCQFKKNKIRAKKNILKSQFYTDLRLDLLERIFLVRSKFCKILLIDNYDDLFIETLNSKIKCANISSVSSDQIFQLQEKFFDLILIPFSMHFINNLQIFLERIKSLLSKDGFFVSKMIGETSFLNLYRLLVTLESKYKKTHQIYLVPPIKKDVLSNVMRRLGFYNIVMDTEILNIRSNSPLGLIRRFKSHGDGNILTKSKKNVMPKEIYKELLREYKYFDDQIAILSLIATNYKDLKLDLQD